MKDYILLADICFDWSGGEYGTKTVQNVYLAHDSFESIEKAKARARELLTEFCEDDYHAKEYDSDVTAIQINL
jgi:hypothetical protein